MGYYVSITQSTVVIEEKNKEEIFKRWKELNSPQYDSQKSGGSYADGQKTKSWYSWMPIDYDKTVQNMEEILKLLGFEYEIQDNGDVMITGYDSKTGQEDLFFAKIANLINPTQYIMWKGEDNEEFVWSFFNGQFNSIDAEQMKQEQEKEEFFMKDQASEEAKDLIEKVKSKDFKNHW